MTRPKSRRDLEPLLRNVEDHVSDQLHPLAPHVHYGAR